MNEDINRFGFGFMRLPQKNSKIDLDTLNQMVDLYIKAGGSYFDTAYPYYDGKSEEAIRKSVIERYPRDKIRLADKMPVYEMTEKDNPQEIFEKQLHRCGVNYFDYYLLHDMEEIYYDGICKKLNLIELLQKYKEEGKIRKLGFSFHDTPEVLDRILTEHPEMEFVLLQINYLDWYNPEVRAKECYEIACKHDVPVMIMEPLKGGKLAKIPKEIEELFNEKNYVPALTALAFVFSLDNVEMILSGMNNTDVMKDNLEFIRNFSQIDDEELELIEKVRSMLENYKFINCSYCNYCKSECPKQIPISSYFKLYNQSVEEKNVSEELICKYKELSDRYTSISECLKCESCEEVCPQHLDISEILQDLREIFE